MKTQETWEIHRVNEVRANPIDYYYRIATINKTTYRIFRIYLQRKYILDPVLDIAKEEDEAPKFYLYTEQRVTTVDGQHQYAPEGKPIVFEQFHEAARYAEINENIARFLLQSPLRGGEHP